MIIEAIMYCDNCRRELTRSQEANQRWEAQQYNMPIEHMVQLCPACSREFLRNRHYHYELDNEGPAL